MKVLINDIITFIKAAVTAGDISMGALTNNQVFKGYWGVPNKPPRGEYITIDDGGETTELNESNDAQWHIYNVRLEFAVYNPDLESALDNILDFSDQIKAQFELEANRQKDGLVWGLDIIPFEMGDADDDFYRGRQVIVQYRELEDTYFQY